jgi:hypothetical protein
MVRGVLVNKEKIAEAFTVAEIHSRKEKVYKSHRDSSCSFANMTVYKIFFRAASVGCNACPWQGGGNSKEVS